jgi:hypothetical protein
MVICGAMSESLPPSVRLNEMIMAQVVSRLVHLAATLKLPDHVADGPRSAAELASVTATHPRSLHRVLRTLASLGLFTEDAEHRFGLTPLGAALKSGEPSRATALILGGELLTRSFDELLYSVQTGQPGFDKAFAVPLFDWLANHPAEASLFSETMVGFHGTEPAAIAAAYDFSGFGTVVDVGGATGNLLATILASHPGPRGILYDLPHVVTEAPRLLRDRGVADRIDIDAGSFLERVPSGGDTYILSHIIHDWDEETCLTILGHCRAGINSNGRLLIVEMVLPAGDMPHPGKMLDMVMLTVPGGQERTEAEYAALLDAAGFRLARVVPTASPVSVVEAFPR